jgi:Fe-S cluster biogenesis protein NfuA/nitrite reductase/ring-hydroxylating ferredoxin subunit
MADRAAEAERLLAEVEALPDPVARETALAALRAVACLYGEGLARAAEMVGADTLAADNLVAHLLVLHDLHPVPVEERVRAALDEVRPYLESHGGSAELLAIEGATARLRLEGSCSGCPSSSMTLKLAIEDAIHTRAPEIESVVADGATTPDLIQIETSWSTVGALPQLAAGRTLARTVDGERLLLMRIDGATYAYRSACPACGESLERTPLAGAELPCPACGRRYDVRGAGRCLDAPQFQLEPFPLLVGHGGVVKVAVGAPA